MSAISLPNAALASNAADKWAAMFGETLPRLRRPVKVAIRQLDDRDNRSLNIKAPRALASLSPLDAIIAAEEGASYRWIRSTGAVSVTPSDLS